MKTLWMHANSVSFVPALVRMDDEREWQWRRSRRWRGGTLIRWEERVTYRHKDNMISITIHETVAIQTTVTRTVTFRNFRRLCQTLLLLSLKRSWWFFNFNKVILSTLQKASSQQFLGTIPPTQTRHEAGSRSNRLLCKLTYRSIPKILNFTYEMNCFPN